jgi:hypothetical protein
MKRNKELHPPFFNFLFQFTYDVCLWPFIDRIIISELAVPQGVSSPVFRYRTGKLGPCLFEELRPFLGIELGSESAPVFSPPGIPMAVYTELRIAEPLRRLMPLQRPPRGFIPLLAPMAYTEKNCCQYQY